MGTDKAVLHEFLRYQRGVIRDVLHGLSEEALHHPVPLPSAWTPVGLILHLGDAEQHWFQDVFLGTSASAPPRPPADAPSTVAFAFYDAQCRLADRTIDAASLTTPPIGRHDDEVLAAQTTDLRRIMLHLIEETARHAGHLDAARELIDGRTGLGPR